MLYVCVRDVMDIMFCFLCASCGSCQCCVLHDLQFVSLRERTPPSGTIVLK